MLLIYNLSIRLYSFIIRIASLFNPKARFWIKGRKNIFQQLKQCIVPGTQVIWVHCASLGEFEQGRPIIESIRKNYPQYKILLTFYSPSGYEIRKNYSGADYIFYLPADTMINARRFINIVKPVKVFFVKYEFWRNYLRILSEKRIPTFLVSASFRPDQIFFKWYGFWYKNVLNCFTHLFVQTEESKILLQKIKIENVTVTGDTRFDRVYEIASKAPINEIAERFSNGIPIFIAGSTWPEDEKLLIQLINECVNGWKFIIAPHEIHNLNIDQLQIELTKKSIRYSEAKNVDLKHYEVLIIDNIGMLSSLYRYARIAYIGGGFGKGIHNILEAATFGMPVIFGPRYEKFEEAKKLIELSGAVSIHSFEELKSIAHLFMTNKEELRQSSKVTSDFVKNNIGATNTILEKSLKD